MIEPEIQSAGRVCTRKTEASPGGEQDSWKTTCILRETKGAINSNFIYSIILQRMGTISALYHQQVRSGETVMKGNSLNLHILHSCIILKNMRMNNVGNIQYHKISQLNFCFWRGISGAHGNVTMKLLLCQRPSAPLLKMCSWPV